MAHDRYLYDPVANEWTIDHYLDDLATRYGGIDAVLICTKLGPHLMNATMLRLSKRYLLLILRDTRTGPTYPNIGVDDRNQFDLIRGMGGGDSLTEMVAEFHSRGVRVLLPYVSQPLPLLAK